MTDASYVAPILGSSESIGHEPLSVFISYSRDDLAFADQLDATLNIAGFSTLIDRHGIDPGEDWKTRLGTLIRNADTVAFVLTTSSARSSICAWEVAEALRLGKRILPVVPRGLEDAVAPPGLAALNYILFYQEPKKPGSSFGTGLTQLVAALKTDLRWMREHTRLLQRATEWTAGGRATNRLLSGADIASAKEWVALRPKNGPPPTELHLDFIRASENFDVEQQSVRQRQLEERERLLRSEESAVRKAQAEQLARIAEVKRRSKLQTTLLIGAVVVAFGFAAFGWYAWGLREQALTASTEAKERAAEAEARKADAEKHSAQARIAEQQANLERNRALLTQSRFLADLSEQHISDGKSDAVTAMLLALAALPELAIDNHNTSELRPYAAEAERVLYKSLYAKREIAVSATLNEQAPSVTFETEKHIQGTRQEPRLADVPERMRYTSPDKTRIVTYNDDDAFLWDAKSEAKIVNLAGRSRTISGTIKAIHFSKNSSHFAAVTWSGEVVHIWDTRTGQPITDLIGHTDQVWMADFSPDGSRVVTSSNDTTARIWDIVTGRTLVILKGHKDKLWNARFSPDGHRIVTGSWDKTARLWDAKSGGHIATLEGHSASVWGTIFGPDGTRVLTHASGDKTARLWDAATGKQIGSPIEHTREITTALFNSDGSRVLTRANHDPTIRITDSSTGKLVAALMPHGNLSMELAPDKEKIVFWTDRDLMIVDFRSGEMIAKMAGHCPSEFEVSRNDCRITDVTFDNNDFVSTKANDNTARKWLLKDGGEIRALRGHKSEVIRSVLSPDGLLLATGSRDTTVRLWEVATGRLISTLSGHISQINGIVFSADGKQILTYSWFDDPSVRVWDTATGRIVGVLGGHSGVPSAKFSRDGLRIVTVAKDNRGHARIWDVRSGQVVCEIKVPEGVWESFHDAVFLLDDTRILTRGYVARIWDCLGNELAQLDGYGLNSVISVDTKWIAMPLDRDSKVAQVWSTDTGAPVAQLHGLTREIERLVFSPDGNRIAATNQHDNTHVWETATGKLISELKSHRNSDYNIAGAITFSPRGDLSVTIANRDHEAHVWDIASGQIVATMQGARPDIYLSSSVKSASFSPDGNRVVTASQDGRGQSAVAIWDAKTGELVFRIDPGIGVNLAQYTADGSSIMALRGDNSVALLRVFPDHRELVEHAKLEVPRCLTPGQMKKFYLFAEPARWCITGPGLESVRDSTAWKPKWPYHTASWRAWQVARDRGESLPSPSE